MASEPIIGFIGKAWEAEIEAYGFFGVLPSRDKDYTERVEIRFAPIGPES